MCGRYSLTKAEEREFAVRFGIEEFSETRLVPRFNIAPSQDVPVVIQEDGHNVLRSFKWGLIPSWAKDLKKTRPTINARIETIAEKPFFNSAIKNRRCLIPADGFFEWPVDSQSGQKIPTYIHLVGRPLFAFAGLWDQWTTPDGEALKTCTIITMPASLFMQPIHDRMPAILTASDEVSWLNPAETDVSKLLSLLVAPGDNALASYPVSRMVNSPRIDSAECITELADSTASGM
jgi:putative SOS response-associated peptidase YedK